jgi:hypothetical protein
MNILFLLTPAKMRFLSFVSPLSTAITLLEYGTTLTSMFPLLSFGTMNLTSNFIFSSVMNSLLEILLPH